MTGSAEPGVADYGATAVRYAKTIAALGGRGSATPAEAAAAESVRRQLAALGVTDLRTQEFLGLRSMWLFLAQAFGLALVGHAAFWLLPGPVGLLPALLISLATFALSFFLLWRKLTFRTAVHASPPAPPGEHNLPNSRLPHGPSQNVIAVLPPASGVAQRRLVLLAHLDSHRAVWLFAHPLLAKVYAWMAPAALLGVLGAPLFYALASLTGQPLFGWLALVFALLHFLAWFTGVTADLGPYSPGANDNASAVGSLLALAERLRQAPLAHTEVWLAFTGCEESGGDGMLRLLAEHGNTLKDALFLDLEMVGIGERLVYLEQEGLLRPRSISPSVRRLVEQVATPSIRPLRISASGAFTEMGIAWEHGFQGVCLLVLSDSEPGLPHWHRLTDIAQNYQAGAFALAHDFAWQLMRLWDEIGAGG